MGAQEGCVPPAIGDHVRFVAELDIKDELRIQTRRLEGLRVTGGAQESALALEKAGYRELAVNSVVSTLYGKPIPVEVIQKIRGEVSIPILFLGGIGSLSDAILAVESGADRVGINSALFGHPALLEEVQDALGAQSVVLQIDTTKVDNMWLVAHSAGREITRIDIRSWINRQFERFSGEVLVTCIDTQGTHNGFPGDLLETIGDHDARLIVSGGLSGSDEIKDIHQRYPLISFSSSRTCA